MILLWLLESTKKTHPSIYRRGVGFLFFKQDWDDRYWPKEDIQKSVGLDLI